MDFTIFCQWRKIIKSTSVVHILKNSMFSSLIFLNSLSVIFCVWCEIQLIFILSYFYFGCVYISSQNHLVKRLSLLHFTQAALCYKSFASKSEGLSLNSNLCSISLETIFIPVLCNFDWLQYTYSIIKLRNLILPYLLFSLIYLALRGVLWFKQV